MKTPNGRIVADQFWYRQRRIAYDDIRTDTRFNIDMSIRRKFAADPRWPSTSACDAMNVLNHTQFNGAYAGALGGTNPTNSPANGLFAGTANANNYGTRGMATFNPREQFRIALAVLAIR